jgi:hypothetical protein
VDDGRQRRDGADQISAPEDQSIRKLDHHGSSNTAPTFKQLGGRFAFDRTHVGLLKEILPSVVEIGFTTSGAARVSSLLKMLGTEAWEARPGSALVIERLLEILLIEVIRHQGEEQAHAHTGLIAGLADPQIAACLHALHENPSRDWSVATWAAKFKKYAVLAGVNEPKKSCHGVRKARAEVAAYADCTESQTLAMFGWTDPKMPAHYIAQANREKLRISGMEKIVAFDQSQSLDELMAPPDANKGGAPSENRVVTLRSSFGKKGCKFR